MPLTFGSSQNGGTSFNSCWVVALRRIPHYNECSPYQRSYSQNLDSRAILRMGIGLNIGIIYIPIQKSLFGIYGPFGQRLAQPMILTVAHMAGASEQPRVQPRLKGCILVPLPRGSKHPIFKDSGPKYYQGYGFWDQRP